MLFKVDIEVHVSLKFMSVYITNEYVFEGSYWCALLFLFQGVMFVEEMIKEFWS